MGILRTRGLDIKAGAAKLKADRAEAELVVDRLNRRLASGRAGERLFVCVVTPPNRDRDRVAEAIAAQRRR
jgi:hypothetical protein